MITSWLSIRSTEDIPPVICTQLIWKLVLSKHFSVLLHSHFASIVFYCFIMQLSHWLNTALLRQQACLKTWYILPHQTHCHTKCHLLYSQLLLITNDSQCFPSTAPCRNLSWHPGECKSNLICIICLEHLKTISVTGKGMRYLIWWCSLSQIYTVTRGIN